MVELIGLALCNSVINWGLSPVNATRTVAADAATLKAVVADQDTQGRLVDGISPLLRPSARLEPSRHPRFVHAMVRMRGRDVLWITWILTPGQGTTEVDLIAQLESRSALARLAMLLGGRRWLRTRLHRTVDVLATHAHRAAEDLDGSPWCAIEGAASPGPRPHPWHHLSPRTRMTAFGPCTTPACRSGSAPSRGRCSTAATSRG